MASLIKGLILLYLFSAFNSYALIDSKLPILKTKQSVFNLRFISSDGELIYYQRKSGDLILTTKFRIIEILKGIENTFYNVYSGPIKKYMIFTKDPNYFNFFGIRHLEEIYISKFGEEKPPKLISEGIEPSLQFNESWLTYFNPYTKIIHFINLENNVLKFEIKLKNTQNPYFIPQSIMIDKNTVLFTDLNESAVPGLLLYNRINGKISVLYKATSFLEKIEICHVDETLYVGIFGFDSSTFGSKIFKVGKDLDIKKMTEIYASKENDIGHLDCNAQKDSLFFIQATKGKTEKMNYDLVKLGLPDNKVTTMSDLLHVTQFINMDGRILIPFRGNYFVVTGESNLSKDNFYQGLELKE